MTTTRLRRRLRGRRGRRSRRSRRRGGRSDGRSSDPAPTRPRSELARTRVPRTAALGALPARIRGARLRRQTELRHGTVTRLAHRAARSTSGVSRRARGARACPRACVLPVPYDFTTSYQGGTRSGPRAILAASRNMELWDEELGAIYRAGIHTLPELEPTARGPEAMVGARRAAVDWILEQGKLPGDPRRRAQHHRRRGARRASPLPGALGAPDRRARRHARHLPRLAVQPRLRHAPRSARWCRRRRSASAR